MKNKKGFLLAEETLKLILAVISLGILAYLLFSLYNANRDSKELTLAKASLDGFFEATNLRNSEFDIYNPNDWHIGSWPSNGKIPVSCSNLGWTECICLCEESNSESCDENGVCLENKNNFEFSNQIQIENPPLKLNINYETKQVSKT